ncbi:MAG: hypothetical protein CSA23_01535 [Deltaproteobacteria bacterium]|nr:MAG: hypothetical protein CSA23_01535 [Deltaproteobacteria bacterium]
MSDSKRSTTVKSLARGLDLLTMIAEADKPLGITDLSRKMGLAKGSVSRIVTTLVQQKFVTRDPESARYRAGIRLWELGLKSLEGLRFREVARPVMEAINGRTREGVHISVLNENNQMVFIDQIESTRTLRPFVRLGSLHPPYCVAMGKALLSVMSREELNQILPSELVSYTKNTITDKDALFDQLQAARKRGYATNHGEYRVDLSGIAAPIFDHLSKAVGTIGIVLASDRLTEGLEKKYGKILSSGAMEISLALGWRP